VDKKSKDSRSSTALKMTVLRMLEDALRLAAYAVEQGRLPDDVVMSDLYRMSDQIQNGGTPLDASDVSLISLYYSLLERELTPVTAVSLEATDCRDIEDCMDTDAGKHAKNLWLIAFSVVALIIGLNLVQYTFEFYATEWAISWPEGLTKMTFVYWLVVTLQPFTYGALGSCVHILRKTEKHLRQRTFDPRRIPQHRNRLVLGTLSGGAIVMFITTGAGADSTLQLTAAAAGFLAGYSVDFLFAILDRILSTMAPQDVEQVAPKQVLAGATAQPSPRVAIKPASALRAKPEPSALEIALQQAPASKTTLPIEKSQTN